MSLSEPLYELVCPLCKSRRSCDFKDIVRELYELKMLRRQNKPEPAVVHELFRQSGSRLSCQKCQHVGLIVEEAEPLNTEEWGEARKCESCSVAIPPERLEVFPDATRCAQCQSTDENTADTGEPEYCPRCGNIMQPATKIGKGMAHYTLICPTCRR